MIRISRFSARHLPLLGTFILVCCTPFFLAHAAQIQLPPLVDYSSLSRGGQARERSQAAPDQTMSASHQTQALQKLLGQYKEIASNGGWPEWKSGKEVRAGASDPRIPTLRLLLTITGDYQPAAAIAATSPIYDDTLLQSVKHFQTRHGLNTDGRLSKSTQAVLSVPVEKRISQIMNTLTRMHDTAAFENKFILINLPAFTLYGVEQDKVALSMRVIVGSRRNHTPLFDNVVTDVVFNPPWSVPARIARNEMIPKLRKNPSYFINAGFIVTQDGEPVDPMKVNPESDDFSFRQRPGAGNALGKIKFNIPDNDNIYLHSTSTPKLFAQEDRALSHGCIRLEKPRDLAHFVMGTLAGWDSAKIDHAYDGSTQRSVRVTEVPVHLVYWTAFVDEAGAVHFYNDVYNKDKGVTAQLEEQKTITLAAK